MKYIYEHLVITPAVVYPYFSSFHREGPGPRLGHGRRHGVARDWIGGDAQTQMDDGGVLLEKLGSDVERLTNDKTLEETEDMAALENLSEATMLECLRRRYRRDRIYSSLGGVVVAINPFRKIERLYDDGYARFGAGDDANLLKPHPYALAESVGSRADAATEKISRRWRGAPEIRIPHR